MGNNLFKLASRFSLAIAIALLVATMVPQNALADDDDDPPSRVARLGYMSGSVSFQPAGTDDWVNAVVNRPITTGDKLWADSDSRAELHIGSASIRMASNTGFSFLNLSDNNTQIRLSAGTLRIRVKRMDDNENFEIDTPNLAFSVLRPGVYKVHVNEDGDSTVIRVRSGEGEVTGSGSAYTVHAREVGTFNGNDQLVADFDNYSSENEDDFDSWNADRDRHEDLSLSSRYVSPDVIGYQDLDDHGWWRPVPEYGYVWFPHTTVVDWAPYRYGHWAYVYPWGYTWIDDAPWGFAPFHYGRWINYGGVWGWVPCPPPQPRVVYVRPVYAPALVAWVGGPHFGVSIAVGGGGNVGWFPLGPREVYVPSYPVSRTYIQKVNVSNTTVNTTVINNYYNNTVINRNTTVVNNNVTVIHQTYVNQSVAGAVTATTPQAFTSAQPVSRNVVRVDQREVASAPVSTFTPPVAPVKQAVLGGAAVARVQPPAAVQTRAVVAKVAPPPPPVPFVKQQQAIQANGGKPLAIAQARQIQTTEVAPPARLVKVAPPAVHQNPQGNPVGQNPQGGFKPFSPSGTGPGNAGGNAGGQQTSGNKPGSPNAPGGPNNPGQPTGGYRPGSSGNTTGNFGGNGGNTAGNNPSPSGNPKANNDRPPSARPNTATSSTNSNSANSNSEATALRQQQLEQKQKQQQEDLKNKQDLERQKVEQQQIAERQRLAQQAADEARQRQLNQKHDQQLQALEQKHDSQDSKLQQKQQDERRKVSPPPKSSKDDHSKDDHSKDDHSHHDR